MAEKTQQNQPASSSHEPTNAEERRVSDAQKEFESKTLTPEQKHQAYLDDVERIRNEP